MADQHSSSGGGRGDGEYSLPAPSPVASEGRGGQGGPGEGVCALAGGGPSVCCTCPYLFGTCWEQVSYGQPGVWYGPLRGVFPYMRGTIIRKGERRAMTRDSIYLSRLYGAVCRWTIQVEWARDARGDSHSLVRQINLCRRAVGRCEATDGFLAVVWRVEQKGPIDHADSRCSF